jgi:hypothetical protein
MVMPVEHDGIRYEALHWGKQRDLGQNGGFVAAFDIETGAELWIAKIYHIEYGDKSPQKYDRFVTELELIEDGAALAVTDQTGAVHRLDLTSREATVISPAPDRPTGPHPDKPAKAPEKPGFFRRLLGGG